MPSSGATTTTIEPITAAMDARHPEDDASNAEANEAFDRVLARHLRSEPGCRLFVGDDLASVNWNGLDAVFGPEMRHHPDTSILAVYDDSAFGRGRYGFIVTDRHVHYVQRDGASVFAIADVMGVGGRADGVRVVLGVGGKRTTYVDLHVDELEARLSVSRWLGAVARFNRKQRGDAGAVPNATKALELLEGMAARGTLEADHVDRVLDLARRLRPDRVRGA